MGSLSDASVVYRSLCYLADAVETQQIVVAHRWFVAFVADLPEIKCVVPLNLAGFRQPLIVHSNQSFTHLIMIEIMPTS
jgi:hypothetical protein